MYVIPTTLNGWRTLLTGLRLPQPDIKSLQIQLTGFLDKDTSKFCQKLWSLCLSGQENPQGVPKELLEAKKLELIQEKVFTPTSHDHESLLTSNRYSWMPRKLPKLLDAKKNRTKSVNETSTM